jgi:hypothetical protein
MKVADYQELAEALSTEQRQALQIVKGHKFLAAQHISNEACLILRELGLVRIELMEERAFIELTQRGQKVAEFV